MPQFVGNLRVFDTSRAAESAGSEIPLARESNFRGDSIHRRADERALTREARIYGADPASIVVSVTINGVRAAYMLRADGDIFTPAYAEVSDFSPAPRAQITVETLAAGTSIGEADVQRAMAKLVRIFEEL